MSKAYTFGENKTEFNPKTGKDVQVWKSPKYEEAKRKAIEALNSELYKNVLEESDFWILKNMTKSGKMAYTGLIISHNGCLKINDVLPANKKFKPSCMSIDKSGYNGSLVFTYINDDQGLYECGEVNGKNCLNAYPYAMALKRCIDRVVLKNSKLAYSGIVSDSEAEEFTNEPGDAVKALKDEIKANKQETAEPEKVAVTLEEIQQEFIKICNKYGLDIRNMCKEYKLNKRSSAEDFAAAYYEIENRGIKGEFNKEGEQ